LLLTSFIMVAGSVCSSGIYADLLPLSAYPPAAAFCSSHFPEPKCTVTATATQALHKRLPAPNAKGGIITVYGKPTTTSTSVHTTATTTAKPLSGVLTENAIPYLFGQLELLAEDFVSTACSCIETPSCVTVRSPVQRVNAFSNTYRLDYDHQVNEHFNQTIEYLVQVIEHYLDKFEFVISSSSSEHLKHFGLLSCVKHLVHLVSCSQHLHDLGNEHNLIISEPTLANRVRIQKEQEEQEEELGEQEEEESEPEEQQEEEQTDEEATRRRDPSCPDSSTDSSSTNSATINSRGAHSNADFSADSSVDSPANSASYPRRHCPELAAANTHCASHSRLHGAD